LEAAEIRNLLLSAILVAGLLLPAVAPDAQTANTVTATCKDGTALAGRHVPAHVAAMEAFNLGVRQQWARRRLPPQEARAPSLR